MGDITYRFSTDEPERKWQAKAALRSLAQHLGGEGRGDDVWETYEEMGTIFDPLLLLDGYGSVTTALEENTRHTVWEARKAGRSWTEIGAALGISKQAAHKRYGGTLDPVRNGRPVDHKTQGGSALH